MADDCRLGRGGGGVPGPRHPRAGAAGSRGKTVRDGGWVTVELVLALPMALLVAVALVWFVFVAGTRVLAADAARAGVRELVAGESSARAVAAVREVIPGARVSTSARGPRVDVVVKARVSGPGPLLGALGHDITGRATGHLEQGRWGRDG